MKLLRICAALSLSFPTVDALKSPVLKNSFLVMRREYRSYVTYCRCRDAGSLPLFAESIGLSSSTGAALVAAFNTCNTLGRFAEGSLGDKIGPINTFVITMVLDAVSMLAIWPVSRTLVPLIILAIVNGMENGSFYTVFPTVVASIFGPGRASVAMSMSITGCTFGYLLGAPIAGYLQQAATGGQKAAKNLDVEDYRPAIFYAGGVALISSLFALLARAHMSKKSRKYKSSDCTEVV
ncbi:hypothetical protein ONS95_004243 [Cadophora gregata]|uniref:uncharacterized protein n=1 Tax=Cadophora gregata TaxID=51156 RepID=UPI0026DCBF28|nr:uncharacterized protein ONS95_004243 [Cadophora gregata]KAK0105721.1 hypothetical protein ONS95_004243 [Cadophora gregata]